MPVVVVHMGTFKSGTSFLQHVLQINRETLADQHVLVPADENGSTLRIFRGFWTGRNPTSLESTALVKQCRQWSGSHVVVSAERLSLLQPPAVQRFLAALEPHPVRIVMTARDLGRAVPSQWQSLVRGPSGARWTYRQYVQAVVDGPARGGPPARMFWERHSWPDVVGPWVAAAGASNVAVATVPTHRGGSDLWARFERAAGLDVSDLCMPSPVNTSLGAASAEVLRRTALAFAEVPATSPRVGVGRVHLLRVLARQEMTKRVSYEPRLAFPPQHRERVEGASRALINRTAAMGTELHGEWSDLLPALPDSVPEGTTLDPDLLALDELASAASFALQRIARSDSIRVDADSESIQDAAYRLAKILTRRAERKKSPLPFEAQAVTSETTTR